MIERRLAFDNRPEYVKKLWAKRTAPGVELSAEEKKEVELLARASRQAEAAKEDEEGVVVEEESGSDEEAAPEV